MNSINLKLSSVIDVDNIICFTLCPSKSLSQRLLIINYLKKEPSSFQKLSNCEDIDVLYHALYSKEKNIYVKQSGTAMRFLLSMFAYENREVVISGDDSLFNRPISTLIESLNMLGANIIKKNDKIVIKKGNLMGGVLNFDLIPTSQFISSLLLVGPYIRHGLTLNFPQDIYSKSYVNMTVSMMQNCGVKLAIKNNQITVHEGFYTESIHLLESDWSSASYLFLAFLFSAFKKIKIKFLNKNSIQGDSVIVDFLSLFGISCNFSNQILTLEKINKIIIPKKIQWNFDQTPDLFPSIVIACFGLGVELIGTGIKTLAYKESNRLLSMKTELLKFNCVLDIQSSDLVFLKSNPKISKNKSICIDTHFDHRIALSFSTLSLLGFELNINNPTVINKSYPDFFNDLTKFGIIIK